MSLLTLKNVGKIYVSEGNISVGIRGVDLSFDRGEFVAVTGRSGSGKSTLLNVISGIDTYEEGELFVNGAPTSHYLQPEWEKYREDYISFIFQDYNIIDSFTVLQNVELALMHIENKAERRKKALELIERVGLTSHVKHKGSKLSGGQKQRTVIARALAKNSPIILADEPTGNLDSQTSREIIELLREVSRDKLLIVVTHNFSEVEEYATRHVRIFDGAVESDTVIRAAEKISEPEGKPLVTESKNETRENLKNGLILGKSVFISKPKLSLFLCILLIVGAVGIFLMTALCGEATDFLEPHYMFNNIEGRVVVTTQNGAVISEAEANKLCDELGADSLLRYDTLLDTSFEYSAVIPTGALSSEFLSFSMESTYGEDFGKRIVGRYPEAVNEVLLYLPVSFKETFGKDTIAHDDLYFAGMNLKIVGIKYYYDNNIVPRCLFTEEGFRTATAAHYLINSAQTDVSLSARVLGQSYKVNLMGIALSFDLPSDKIYVSSKELLSITQGIGSLIPYSLTVNLSSTYFNYDYNYGNSSTSATFEHSFTDADMADTAPNLKSTEYFDQTDKLVLSDELIRMIAEETLDKSYRQISLFFSDSKKADKAAEALKDMGYIAVPADTTYEPDPLTTIAGLILCFILLIVWVLSIIFLSFFINLCLSRVLGAFKADMAIMRSMGISVAVIRIGMYARMLIALVPAFIAMALAAVVIYTSPSLNAHFVYLYAWQYILIFLGMIYLSYRITRKQVSRLFGESVKNSLRGGNSL